MAQDLAEGRTRAGKDRLHHHHITAGNADVVAAARRGRTRTSGPPRHLSVLDVVAEAWGYLEPAAIREPLELLDRILAMTWKLTRDDG